MFQSATAELMRRPVKASKNPKFLPIWGVVNDNDEGERERERDLGCFSGNG